MLEYAGMCWDVLGCDRMCKNVQEYAGMCWDVLECARMCWNVLERAKIVLGCAGMS